MCEYYVRSSWVPITTFNLQTDFAKNTTEKGGLWKNGEEERSKYKLQRIIEVPFGEVLEKPLVAVIHTLPTGRCTDKSQPERMPTTRLIEI